VESSARDEDRESFWGEGYRKPEPVSWQHVQKKLGYMPIDSLWYLPSGPELIVDARKGGSQARRGFASAS